MTPRETPYLFGHAAAEATFDAALADGHMHHAWFLTGPPGIGKATLAYRLARRLFAGPGRPAHDPALPLFRRVAEGSHADLLTIEREWDDKRKRLRAEIVVDTVRAAPSFLHLTPAEGGWRVVVIDGAEAMNRNAANALLKVLEEPPARAVLLLTCNAPGRLPATIRSRCRLLRLVPLGPDAMEAALTQILPGQDHAGLAAMAHGAPGRALALAGQGLAVAALVDDTLARHPVTSQTTQAVADALARSEDGYGEYMHLLRQRIAAAVRGAASGKQVGAVTAHRPLAAWVDLWQTLGRIQDETERFHLDRRQAIVSAIDRLNGP